MPTIKAKNKSNIEKETNVSIKTSEANLTKKSISKKERQKVVIEKDQLVSKSSKKDVPINIVNEKKGKKSDMLITPKESSIRIANKRKVDISTPDITKKAKQTSQKEIKTGNSNTAPKGQSKQKVEVVTENKTKSIGKINEKKAIKPVPVKVEQKEIIKPQKDLKVKIEPKKSPTKEKTIELNIKESKEVKKKPKKANKKEEPIKKIDEPKLQEKAKPRKGIDSNKNNEVVDVVPMDTPKKAKIGTQVKTKGIAVLNTNDTKSSSAKNNKSKSEKVIIEVEIPNKKGSKHKKAVNDMVKNEVIDPDIKKTSGKKESRQKKTSINIEKNEVIDPDIKKTSGKKESKQKKTSIDMVKNEVINPDANKTSTKKDTKQKKASIDMVKNEVINPDVKKTLTKKKVEPTIETINPSIKANRIKKEKEAAPSIATKDTETKKVTAKALKNIDEEINDKKEKKTSKKKDITTEQQLQKSKKEVDKKSEKIEEIQATLKKAKQATTKKTKEEKEPEKPIFVTTNARYSDEELNLFKARIIELRKEAIDELRMLKDRLDDLNSYDFAEESMIYSMHMAEQGSEAMEKEKTYAQIQRINEYIKKLDEALQRIKDKTYGICRVCGCLIAKERLMAVPITTLSASYKIHKRCPEDGIDRIEPLV